MDIKNENWAELISELKNPDSARLAERLLLKEFLPIDLRLKLTAENKWDFQGDLVRRRHSPLASDKFFFKILPSFKTLASMTAAGSVEFRAKILKEQDHLSLSFAQDLSLIIDGYTCLDILRLPSGFPRQLGLFMGDLGLSVANKNPFLASEIKKTLRKNKDDFGADLISIELGEDRDKISADINEFLASGEYYAAGKLAVLIGDREAVKYCLKKLMEILNNQPFSKKAVDEFLPKIISYFYPVSDEESRYYLSERFFEGLLGETAEEVYKITLSFSFVELFQSVIPEDKEFGRKLFNGLLKSGRRFEAAMAAIALGDNNFPRLVRQELYFSGRYNERTALTLALGASDPEFGWKVTESLLENHLDPTIPPISVARLAAIVCRKRELTDVGRQKILGLVGRLLAAGSRSSLFTAGMLAISIRNRELFFQALLKLNQSRDGLYQTIFLKITWLKKIAFSPETKRTLKAIYSISDEIRYLIQIVYSLLITFPGGISCIRFGFLPGFTEIKKLFLSTEDRYLPVIQEEKSRILDEFSEVICDLQSIFLQKTDGIIRILLSRGIRQTADKLESYRWVLGDSEIIPRLIIWLKSSPEISETESLKLMDFAHDYSMAGCSKIFTEIISKSPPYDKLITELGEKIKTILFKKLGIKKNGLNGNGRWPKNYPVYLLGHDNLMKLYPRSKRFFYRKFLRVVFENRFSEWISDVNQQDKIGQKIARHNQEVEKAFLAVGVNFVAWNNPGFEEVVSIGECRAEETNDAWQALEQCLLILPQFFENSPLLPSLRKDIIAIQKQKNKPFIFEQDLEGEDWLKKVFPVYSRSIESIAKSKKERGLETISDVPGDMVILSKSLIKQWLSKFNVKRSFRIRIWDRNPSHDLFHGNYSKCCLALGVKTLNQDLSEGSVNIMDYLVDKGIQVVEIIDEESDETIGQCWPFVSGDESGKLLLAIDSVDFDYPYRVGTTYNSLLRDGMFRFLKRYAEAIGVKKVVLGASWYNGDLGECRVDNKVPTDDLSGALFPKIEKLGGFWNSRPYFLYMQDATKGFLIR